MPFRPGDPDLDDNAAMPVGWQNGDPERPNGEPWDLSHHVNFHRRVSVVPKRGTALLWYNHLPNERPKKWTDPGHVDRLALHGGCELRNGVKWIATLWTNPPGWYQKQMKRYTPKQRKFSKAPNAPKPILEPDVDALLAAAGEDRTSDYAKELEDLAAAAAREHASREAAARSEAAEKLASAKRRRRIAERRKGGKKADEVREEAEKVAKKLGLGREVSKAELAKQAEEAKRKEASGWLG